MHNEPAEGAASGEGLTREEALSIAGTPEGGAELFDLFSHANRVRESHRGKTADLCSIISAKTGGCPEDCSYCAQSGRSSSDIKASPLIGIRDVVDGAGAARRSGAKRFCIVTSGMRPTNDELLGIADMVSAVRDEGLMPCATLGMLTAEELIKLSEAGLKRYHHNLETSERFFPFICTTHTYRDKIEAIKVIKSTGLSLCSGGIFGLGETWEDRVEMALELRGLGADSIPINFLVPIKGTPMGDMPPLRPLEALKIISLYRLILPEKEIRVCGGRLQTLGEFNSFVFMAGADGLLTGDCLTTPGGRPVDDLRLAMEYGLTV